MEGPQGKNDGLGAKKLEEGCEGLMDILIVWKSTFVSHFKVHQYWASSVEVCHEATYYVKRARTTSGQMCVLQVQWNSHAGEVRAREQEKLKSIALWECPVELNMIPTLYYLKNMGADTIVSWSWECDCGEEFVRKWSDLSKSMHSKGASFPYKCGGTLIRRYVVLLPFNSKECHACIMSFPPCCTPD